MPSLILIQTNRLQTRRLNNFHFISTQGERKNLCFFFFFFSRWFRHRLDSYRFSFIRYQNVSEQTWDSFFFTTNRRLDDERRSFTLFRSKINSISFLHLFLRNLSRNGHQHWILPSRPVRRWFEKERNEIFLSSPLLSSDNHRTANDFIQSTNSNHLIDILILRDDKLFQQIALWRRHNESNVSSSSSPFRLMNISDSVAKQWRSTQDVYSCHWRPIFTPILGLHPSPFHPSCNFILVSCPPVSFSHFIRIYRWQKSFFSPSRKKMMTEYHPNYESPRSHEYDDHGHSNQQQNQQMEQQPPQVRSSTLERGRSVRLMRNGDSFFTGRGFVINQRKYPLLDAFMDDASQALRANFGAVSMYLYTDQWHPITRHFSTGE